MSSEKNDLKLTESMEDYLEAVLILSSQLPSVRSVDVASYLGYSKPSVSHAVKVMIAKGLLEATASKQLLLTPKGKEIAQGTYQRHVFFTQMLTDIGVDLKTAEEDACRIEHVISEETFQAIRTYYSNTESSFDS